MNGWISPRDVFIAAWHKFVKLAGDRGLAIEKAVTSLYE